MKLKELQSLLQVDRPFFLGNALERASSSEDVSKKTHLSLAYTDVQTFLPSYAICMPWRYISTRQLVR